MDKIPASKTTLTKGQFDNLVKEYFLARAKLEGTLIDIERRRQESLAAAHADFAEVAGRLSTAAIEAGLDRVYREAIEAGLIRHR